MASSSTPIGRNMATTHGPLSSGDDEVTTPRSRAPATNREPTSQDITTKEGTVSHSFSKRHIESSTTAFHSIPQHSTADHRSEVNGKVYHISKM